MRVEIAPDYQTEEKFEQLLAFCKKANVDDIQFFTSAEELNNGHMTVKEAKPWLDMLRSFMPRLWEARIGVSLNPGLRPSIQTAVPNCREHSQPRPQPAMSFRNPTLSETE